MTQRVWKTLKKKSCYLKLPQKTFNLLSIGQERVGKTVFLAGSYIELHGDSQTKRPQQLWFDCQDSQVQENVERILATLSRPVSIHPHYESHEFQLQPEASQAVGVQTLCHFRWWDIPGEICNMHNLTFAWWCLLHACCVFIDACACTRIPIYRRLRILSNRWWQLLP